MVEHWLHFIGRGLYSQAVFEREAKRLGVQRACSFRFLHSLDYGVPILLGYHIRDYRVTLRKKDVDMRKHPEGTGEIIGYFNVEALVHNLDEDIREDLMFSLDCDCSSVPPTNAGRSRACGSYSILAICSCRNSWDEILTVIKQACELHNQDPASFRYFIQGTYHRFETPISLDPIKFMRGYEKVEIMELDLTKQEVETRNLVWIFDYKQRRYLKLKERRAIKNRSMNEFTGEK